jgi:hypothetical protein
MSDGEIRDFDLDVKTPAHVPIVLRAAAHWYAAKAEEVNFEGNPKLARQWQAMADMLHNQAGYAYNWLERNPAS